MVAAMQEGCGSSLFKMNRLPKQLRRGVDSLFFLIGWSIWKERNARTFNGVSTSATRLEVSIQEEADAWCMAGYKHLGALMASI